MNPRSIFFCLPIALLSCSQSPPATPPTLDAGCDKGKIVNAVTEPNPDVGGWRISLELDPQDNKLVELHARLTDGERPLTETWMYRWTPS